MIPGASETMREGGAEADTAMAPGAVARGAGLHTKAATKAPAPAMRPRITPVRHTMDHSRDGRNTTAFDCDGNYSQEG